MQLKRHSPKTMIHVKESENTKGVIRIHKSKKNSKHNSQKKDKGQTTIILYEAEI